MQTVDLDTLTFTGALDVDRTADGGVVLRRLPDRTRHQIVDPALAVLLTMPAGVRLEVETDTTELELDVMLTVLQLGEDPPVPAAFDLVVDGAITDVQRSTEGTRIVVDMRTGAIDFHPGSPTTIRFAGLPGRAGTRVEVWLPHAAVVEVRGVRIDDGATVAAGARRGRRWIHHGSSISHCMEAERPTETWPSFAARLADVDLLHLGFAGQCMLDPYVARTIRDEPADVISLKIGINIINGDTMRERAFVPALHGFLDTVREGHPDTPFLVVTPIAFPGMEDRHGPTIRDERSGTFVAIERAPELMTGALTLARIRELVTQVVEARQRAGDADLHLLDGRRLFPEDEAADLPDGLHPNPAGYRRMGQRFFDLALADGGPLGAR